MARFGPREMVMEKISGSRVVMAIATVGRPQIVCETIAGLLNQSRVPDAIFVCAPTDKDVEGLAEQIPMVEITLGVRGSCIQRNALIRKATREDILVFFDDDFVPHDDYLEKVESIFSKFKDIAVITGRVIADGATGPGFDVAEAKSLLAHEGDFPSLDSITDTYSGYGCNMAVRAALLLDHEIYFDESLPLYGWLEDVDLSRRLSCYGRIVRVADAKGVHLGVKGGRQSGRRLGYSQVANPVYLARKGTLSWVRALNQLGRNVTANGLRCLRPEPYVDRRGRVAGNVRALIDFATGRLDPRRVLKL